MRWPYQSLTVPLRVFLEIVVEQPQPHGLQSIPRCIMLLARHPKQDLCQVVLAPYLLQHMLSRESHSGIAASKLQHLSSSISCVYICTLGKTQPLEAGSQFESTGASLVMVRQDTEKGVRIPWSTCEIPDQIGSSPSDHEPPAAFQIGNLALKSF